MYTASFSLAFSNSFAFSCNRAIDSPELANAPSLPTKCIAAPVAIAVSPMSASRFLIFCPSSSNPSVSSEKSWSFVQPSPALSIRPQIYLETVSLDNNTGPFSVWRIGENAISTPSNSEELPKTVDMLPITSAGYVSQDARASLNLLMFSTVHSSFCRLFVSIFPYKVLLISTPRQTASASSLSFLRIASRSDFNASISFWIFRVSRCAFASALSFHASVFSLTIPFSS